MHTSDVAETENGQPAGVERLLADATTASAPLVTGTSASGGGVGVIPPRNGAPSLAAAVLLVLPLSPFLAGFCLMTIYILPGTNPVILWAQANVLLTGCALGLLISGLLAVLYCYMLYGTAADHAHATAWTEQSRRLLEIEARLAVHGARSNLNESELAACKRADACRQLLRAEMAIPGLRWVLGIGYMAIWNLIHRAEEALVLIEPTDDVLGVAYFDRLRLEDSSLPTRKLLQDQLATAITALQRNPTQFDARLAISQVRTTINEFRDSSREALVRTRNHTMGTLLSTGVTALILLGVAIVSQHGAAGLNLSADPAVSAVVLYLVGALIGLFSRLNSESGSEDQVEDYGLTVARLLLTPVLSGLAAVGGVLIIALVPLLINGGAFTPSSSGDVTQTVDRAIPQLHMIYNLQANPLGLALAAAFGLTPSLLVSALQRAADSAKVALSSTTATTAGSQHS
jgi:hypothetical protein